MIDLKKFCRKSHYSGTLTEPFSDDNYTYAADGSVLIRIDKIPEIIKVYPSINPEKILEENKVNGNEIWIDLPKFEIIERNCSKCKGTGKIIRCKECGGVGSLEFSSDYNDYDVECKSCLGKSIKDKKCEDCDGTGKHKKYSNTVVKASARVMSDTRKNITLISGEHFGEITVMINGMYLEMIQDLPNIKIAIQGDPLKPIKLKFDGGIGLLMPMEMDKS